MRNPPWALFLAAPLGLLRPLPGMILWTLAAVGCILASARLMNVPPGDQILVFLFAPALAAVMTGQSSPFLLLGFVLFLRFNRSVPLLAGGALLLMAIKPHLFLVFWAILFADCIYRRSFRLLAGAALAIAAATACALALDPHAFSQYLAMFHASKLQDEFVPTLSIAVRLVFGRSTEWAQLLPSGFALAWGCRYYARNRQTWDWRKEGLVVMLITVLASPYSWFSDEIVLLPAIAFAFGKRRSALVIVNGIALLLLAFQVPLTSGLYIWTAPAWLGCYLYASLSS